MVSLFAYIVLLSILLKCKPHLNKWKKSNTSILVYKGKCTKGIDIAISTEEDFNPRLLVVMDSEQANENLNGSCKWCWQKQVPFYLLLHVV